MTTSDHLRHHQQPPCALAPAAVMPSPGSRFPHIGDKIAHWTCPVCSVACHRRYHPGRPRVYCTNACRQRAYRMRREQRATQHVTSHERPPERARTRDRVHACRPDNDVVLGGRHDSTGRVITACGAFGRADRDRGQRYWHTEFMTGGPFACRSCATVLHVPDVPIADVIERALRHRRSAQRVR